MPLRRSLLATSLLLALYAINPAHATTAVVPDSFPTIQAGLDSWRDTVLVRGGHYDEDLVLDTGVTLAVIPSEAGGDTVETGGLRIRQADEVPGRPYRSLVGVRGFHFAGRVWQELILRGTSYRFVACRMDSGVTIPYRSQTWVVSIDSCTILNGITIFSPGSAPYVTNNTVLSGGIEVHNEGGDCFIRGNHVFGPVDYGIWAYVDSGGWLEGNTIIGAEVGIYVKGGYAQVHDNVVMECSGSGIFSDYSWNNIERNLVQDCGGRGIDATRSAVNWNTILACQSGGIRLSGSPWPGLVGNVVGRCGGPGIEASGSGVVQRNTCYLNSGPGFGITATTASVANNIACENSGPGLLWSGGATPTLACNDWFANTGGATIGTLPGPTDLAVDPLFCNPGRDSVHLSAGSPLLDASGCGLIGALGQGCVGVPTPVLLSLVSAEAGADGVKLVWFMGGSGSDVATVYRSAAGGTWTRIGEVKADGTGYLRYTDPIDATAIRWGYRLGIIDAGIEGFYGETWVDLPADDDIFALASVSPNPSHGERLSVTFALPTQAMAKLELLDVSGRRIVKREVGSLGAGRHTLDLGHGTHLAPGLYLVRLTQGANTRTTRATVLR